MSLELIFTNDQCVGCNKCIASCPVMYVNRAIIKDGKNKVYVEPDACIHCGRCIEACAHNAREYADDTDAFFTALNDGEELSLLVAPSFIANYPTQYKHILGYLKHLGVKHVYSVSFGADITIWGYLNYIRDHHFYGGISQPCPVVVDYIEKYMPDLIEKLVPVQSPLMCTAIYLKKYLGITDKLAFLSPCIAKKSEIMRPENQGAVSYNVTFAHLMARLGDTNITSFSASDELDYGLGAIFPMPGGLNENIKHFLGRDAMIRQVEGEPAICDFFEKYLQRIQQGRNLPHLVDALNCSLGCLAGTGVCRSPIDHEDVLMSMSTNIQNASTSEDEESPWAKNLPYDQRMERLNERFSALSMNDFLCHYTNSRVYRPWQEGSAAIEEAFVQLNKLSAEDRHIDCGACGYKSCRNMAIAISEGFNRRENCVYYLKRNLEGEKEKLSLTINQLEKIRLALKVKAETDAMTGVLNRNNFQELVEKILYQNYVLEDNNTLICAMGILDLDGLKDINDTFGHIMGDEAIRRTAIEMKETLRRNDLIARLGGDEFIFFIKNIRSEEQITKVAERLLTRLSTHKLADDRNLTASLGISLVPRDGLTFTALYERADAALYSAKRAGKNQYGLFNTSK